MPCLDTCCQARPFLQLTIYGMTSAATSPVALTHFNNSLNDSLNAFLSMIREGLEGVGGRDEDLFVCVPAAIGCVIRVSAGWVDWKSASTTTSAQRKSQSESNTEGESTRALFQFWEHSLHSFPSKGLKCQFNHFAYFGFHLIKMLVVLEQQLGRSFAVCSAFWDVI